VHNVIFESKRRRRYSQANHGARSGMFRQVKNMKEIRNSFSQERQQRAGSVVSSLLCCLSQKSK